MARPPAADRRGSRAARERDQQQHDRHGGGADRGVALDLLEDEDRRRPAVWNGMLPGDQDDRAELADRAGERQRAAATDRRARGSAGRSGGTSSSRRRRARPPPPPSRGRARSAPAAPSARRTAASRTAAPAAPPSACTRRRCRPGCSARRARAASSPATIVGSANGRSISALTTRLPRKLVAHEHPGDQRARHRVDRARRRATRAA